jgi:hypothetical protein
LGHRRLREASAVRDPHLIEFGETTRWLLIAETTNDVLFESAFKRAGPRGQMFAAIAARLLQNCEMRLERKNN